MNIHRYYTLMEEIMNINWYEIGYGILGLLLPPLIYIVTLKINQILMNVGDVIKGSLIDDVALRAVRSVTQELGEDLRKKSADGKLTEEEKAQLKSLAVSRTAEGIKAVGLQISEEAKGYIATVVESAYARLKNSRGGFLLPNHGKPQG